jgi:hypothetical protein
MGITLLTEADDDLWRVDYSLTAPPSLAPRQVRGGQE